MVLLLTLLNQSRHLTRAIEYRYWIFEYRRRVKFPTFWVGLLRSFVEEAIWSYGSGGVCIIVCVVLRRCLQKPLVEMEFVVWHTQVLLQTIRTFFRFMFAEDGFFQARHHELETGSRKVRLISIYSTDSCIHQI